MRQGSRARIVGFTAWVAALALLGCGSTASPASPGTGGSVSAAAGNGTFTAGANASGGAMSGGAGGAGGASSGGANAGSGGLVLGDSNTEACIAYAMAVCARQDQCSGTRGGDCLRVSYSCPDLVFSRGATRTPAVLKACADAYQKLPCDQIELGILPECVTPGTVALGQPCSFSSQCASLACGGDGTCGACVPSAHEGEACTEPANCLGFLNCSAGKCTRTSGGAVVGKALGEECSSANAIYCQAGLHCDAATSKCAGYPMLGMSCADTRTCGGDSYCELDGLSCKAYPGEGAPCGVDGFTGGAAYCKTPLICARTSMAVGTCVKVPDLGQPCVLDPESGAAGYGACVPAARCDQTQSPPMCVGKASQGQACAQASDCAPGTSCICPNAETSCDVTAKICGRVQLKGQPCTATGEVCHPGFSCAAGVCEPRDSQGLFTAACGL